MAKEIGGMWFRSSSIQLENAMTSPGKPSSDSGFGETMEKLKPSAADPAMWKDGKSLNSR
ncbi:hypothetical protein LJC56_10335 [Christensenellaceae bacterium OttesenSCG-928-K19]|nr:hypothetical protein [Christensenellaceae bacterium OttesenSCG-928-K19]